jgi:hypothetical protein
MFCSCVEKVGQEVTLSCVCEFTCFHTFGVIQVKVMKKVGVTISQTMDLLEANETQVLAKLFPKFLDYKKHLQ